MAVVFVNGSGLLATGRLTLTNVIGTSWWIPQPRGGSAMFVYRPVRLARSFGFLFVLVGLTLASDRGHLASGRPRHDGPPVHADGGRVHVSSGAALHAPG